MRFTALPLSGAYLVEPTPFRDERGFFSRIHCAKELQEATGQTKPIAQINHSRTEEPGSIRGMHYQLPPYAEMKIIKCVRGAVFDVIIDLRKDSPTFLHWCGEILSADNLHLMVAPEGFAHGFQSLEPGSEVIYFVTEPYAAGKEAAVRFDDPRIGIKWPLPVTVVSQKDRATPDLPVDFAGLVL
ncbi:dTDP-4-dehydrorhamnose 3,5-epimerase [Fundidesulfovibrio butyratiphilus]